MIGIINASPLIFLGKLGVLDLLPQLFEIVITTDQVRKEVLNKEVSPEKGVLHEAFDSWIEIKNPKDNQLLGTLQEMKVHQGEASILVLAKELRNTNEKAITVIDDLAAREIAKTLKVPVIGTLGVLLKGVEQRIISRKKCTQLIDDLIDIDHFYLSARMYSHLLRFLTEYENKTD